MADQQPLEGKRKKPVSKSTLTGTDSAKWLEMALAVDHTVIKFHGKEHVQQYVLTLLNIASSLELKRVEIGVLQSRLICGPAGQRHL